MMIKVESSDTFMAGLEKEQQRFILLIWFRSAIVRIISSDIINSANISRK
jgi:hypothetical protein